MIKIQNKFLNKTVALIVIAVLLTSTLFAQFVSAENNNSDENAPYATVNGEVSDVNAAIPTAFATDAVLNATPSKDIVKVGQEFTATLSIHNVENIFAEDIKIAYDTDRFEFLGVGERDGIAVLNTQMATQGVIQVISASMGTQNVVSVEKNLFDLKFRAKSVGEGKIDIIAGRIADNVSLEVDVPSYACGDATVGIWISTDVNRSGATTLLDLGIDAGYYGYQVEDTDINRYDADVVPNGYIDKDDLNAIAGDLADNPYYPNYK